MKRNLLLAAAFLVSSSAFANDVDLVPNGYVSSVIRATQSESKAQAAASALGGAGYRLADAPSMKTRAQVAAEARAAARLGLLSHGESGAADPTPEQARDIERAGLHALAIEDSSK